MMLHELKTWPQYFCRVKDGSKTFEVRKNDRDFNKGDTVVLKEWAPPIEGCPGHYTNEKELIFTIGYVFRLDDEKVVFSLLGSSK